MKMMAFILAACALFTGTSQAQLAKYFSRSIEQRVAVVTGSAIPTGPFVQKSTLDPNAGYANISFLGGLEYSALPMNGGIGLTASVLASSQSVSMLPGGATGGKYFTVSMMGGPRYEMGVTGLPISLYGHGLVGGVYAKSPDLILAGVTRKGGNDFSFGVAVGGGVVFDRMLDVGVRYFYSEAKFGDNRLSTDPVTRIEGLQATVGFLIF